MTHRPNWNDVRIVRAVLSLLEAATRDPRTTHVLLCTESCVPVATLGEVARSVLLDEICCWKPDGGDDGADKQRSRSKLNRDERPQRKRGLDWDRSYVDCYDRDSRRCTRFDEREFSSLICYRGRFASVVLSRLNASIFF